MTAMPATKKPRVIGIVGLSILGGILNLLAGIGLLSLISSATQDPTVQIPAWVTIVTYLILALGVIDLVVGVLLLMYKRLGLILAAISFGVGLLLGIYNIISAGNSVSQDVSLVIQLAVLYYVYIYLTREPEKSFFT